MTQSGISRQAPGSAEGARPNWFRENPRKARWLVFLLLFLMVEGLIRLGVAAGLIPYRTYPTNREPVFWAHIDPVVGMWRFPNRKFHHDEKCLDVWYETNSVGARDRERAFKSDAARRFIVLGDSMMEGYGLASEYRMSDVLEARTSIEFLNFATSGGFGTIQEWQLYDKRLRGYDHTDVVVAILPENDFQDNRARPPGSRGYFPYLRPAGGTYELYYPVRFEERADGYRKLSTVIKNTIDNNIYIANVLRTGTRMLKTGVKKQARQYIESDYDSFNEQDLKLLLFTLDQIAVSAGARRVHLVTLPSDNDFYYARTNGYRFRLVTELQAFARQRPNVDYLDLLPAMLADAGENGREFRDYQLPCDRHWGPAGHALAADVLQQWLSLPGDGAVVREP